MRFFKLFGSVLLSIGLVGAQNTCSNGLIGVETDGICCNVDCGTCGGSDWRDRGKGLGAADCCRKFISNNGALCSENASAPCIIDDVDETSEADDDDAMCSNGFVGVESENICCHKDCGTCGGSGCKRRGNGLEVGDCCTTYISENGALCSENGSAPCIMDDVTETSEADDDDAMCSNGFVGVESENICCHKDCGTCGGSGCKRRGNGLEVGDCCTTYISENGALCSENGSAPCIMDDVTDGDIPTTLSPTPLMTIPTTCAASTGLPAFRYAASTGVNGRLYAEGEGCFTITDLYNFRLESDGSAKGPIYNLDDSYNTVLNPEVLSNKWLLTAELHITGGAVFYCRGSSIGGDCDELRIQSTGPTDFYEVRAHGGSMYFESTIVTAWDTPNKTPQATYEGGRSFLNCVSEKLTGEVCLGQAQNEMGECRMDIINSEIGYLGYFDSESYGLTWKVRGFCKDLSNPDVFDITNVYGNLIGSDIHHNYYGQYSYGHQGGVWHNNQMHDNHQYGFDPHDDSDYLTISHNVVYNNVNHGIIASKRCNNVQIYNNEVYDGGPFAVGIFLHRSSDYAIVYDNVVHNMQDAGMALLESMNADIYNNEFSSVKFGIRLSLGSSDNYVHENLFEDVSTQGLYTYQGSDEPTDGVSDGRPSDNLFENNNILNAAKGVKIKEADDTVITDNVFTGTSELEFFDAQNTRWNENTLPQGVCIKNIDSDDGIDIELSTFDRRTAGLPTLEC